MKRILLPVLLMLGMSGCVCFRSPSGTAAAAVPAPRHALVGAWRASDGTVFVFRDDGTFVGADVRRREIWGNWVALDPMRIGFQSLMHDSYYRPQYAVIRADDVAAMDYIVTGGKHFIAARRIEPEAAVIEIAERTRAGVVWPAPRTDSPGE